MRKNLLASKILKIEIDELDRIIFIPYFRSGKLNCFSFFWKGRDLFFQNVFCDKENRYWCLKSWVGNTQLLEHDFKNDENGIIDLSKKIFDELDRGVKIGETFKKGIYRHSNDSFVEEYFESKIFFKGEKLKQKKLKSLLIKKRRIEEDLKKVCKCFEIEEKLKNNEINVDGLLNFSVLGKNIKFSKEWTSFKKIDLLYQRVKKLKKGARILKERLIVCCDEINKYENIELEKRRTTLSVKTLNPIWKTDLSVNKVINLVDNSNFEEYLLDEKHKLAFGKSAKGNDHLRKVFAKKDDFWFHIENYKSSHCIVKIKKISDLKDLYLDVIGSALRDKSSLKIERIPLIFTQVKNLKGVKGKPGSVQFKKEKYRTVSYNKSWKEIISKN